MAKQFWILAALSVAVTVGCGKDNNTTSNNTTSNNTTPANNTTSTTNTTNTTATNNTTPTTNNVTTSNPRTEPYITQFRYYVEDENALGNNRQGFTVTVLTGEIANEGGNSGRMLEADAAEFESTYLTTATIEKMRNGWGCRIVVPDADMGSPADMGAPADMGMAADLGSSDTGTGFVSEATYWFEALIQEGGNSREIVEVTGCVLDADAEVLEVIEALETLGATYL